MHQNILEFCVKKTFGDIDFTFKISNITISLDDTPWWLLTSNDMHVVNNLSVSTVPNPHYSLEVSGNTYIHSGDQTSETSYTLIVDGSTNITGGDLIVATGNVGIGTASPESALHVRGEIDATPNVPGVHIGSETSETNTFRDAIINMVGGDFTDAEGTINFWKPNTYGGRIRYTHNGHIMEFVTNSTEKMRIHSNGNVGIGTDGPSYTLDVSGTFNVDGATTLGSTLDVSGTFNIDGATTLGSTLEVASTVNAQSYTANSDETLKENIKILTDPLEKILQLEGKIYNWKKDKEKTQHAGLIAQEVEQHIKEVVIDDHADGKKGIDYNGLIPYLVECIKTQQKQIDTLNDRIASLENK